MGATSNTETIAMANSDKLQLRSASSMFSGQIRAAVCWLLFTGLPLAPSLASESDISDKAVAQKIDQLGDPSFVIRETATRDLQRFGPQIQSQLIVALDHPDAEVRQRVRHVLHAVMKEDLRNRVNRFSNGQAGDDDPQLPGWEYYRDILGDGEAVRAQFAEALLAEPILMESLDQESAYAAHALQIRTQALYEKLIRTPGTHQQKNSRSRIAVAMPHMCVSALLIAAMNPDIQLDEQTGQKIFQLMQHSGYTQRISADPNPQPTRHLVGQFVRRSVGTSLAYQMLWMSMQYNLKEGLIPAEAIVRQQNQQPYVLQNAMLAIGKLGGKEHLGLLSEFLRDETPVTNRRASGGLRPQVRDVALAITIHLHNKNPRDFGFNKIRDNTQTLFQANTMGFDNQQGREAAFAAWDKWIRDQKTTNNNQP